MGNFNLFGNNVSANSTQNSDNTTTPQNNAQAPNT